MNGPDCGETEPPDFICLGRYFLAECADSSGLSISLRSTGEERTIEVEVVPKGVSLSIRASRCSTERTCTFMMKESAPVPRWHSTISGEPFTTAVIREKTSPTTDMRMNAVIG